MTFRQYLLDRFVESKVGSFIITALIFLLIPIWGPILIIVYPFLWYREVKKEYNEKIMTALKTKDY